MNGNENERPRHLKLASASLGLGVAGVVGLFYWSSAWSLLVPIAAVACGYVARFRIGRSNGSWSGNRVAVAGCTLGAITMIGMVAVFFIPATSNALLEGRTTTTVNNGRNFYVTLFARGLENPLDPTPAWPQLDAKDGRVFQSSTEFIEWAVTSGVINVDFSFFAGPGLSAVKSRDAGSFSADNNAWCVVSGVNSNTPAGMPVLFTRNLGVTNLNQLTGPVQDTVIRGSPLEIDAVVLILNGGRTAVVPQKFYSKTWEEVLSKNASWYGDHPVLRP